MTHRTNLTPEQREAHSILDRVRAGYFIPERRVQWALIVLGDVQ